VRWRLKGPSSVWVVPGKLPQRARPYKPIAFPLAAHKAVDEALRGDFEREFLLSKRMDS